MQEITNRQIGQIIKAKAVFNDIPLSYIADTLGITQFALSKKISGTVAFKINELVKVADVLSWDLNSLITEAQEVPPKKGVKQ